MHLLGILAIIYVIYQLIKEACEPTLTAEHWANKELQHQDEMNGMSMKQVLKNAEKGRYYIPKEIFQAYPEPHREPDGKRRICVENRELHKADLSQYNCLEVHKWVEQGKYNLNASELEITKLQYELNHLKLISSSSRFNYDKEKARIEEIKKILATKNWDCRNTEAIKQWQKAREAELQYRRAKGQRNV